MIPRRALSVASPRPHLLRTRAPHRLIIISSSNRIKNVDNVPLVRLRLLAFSPVVGRASLDENSWTAFDSDPIEILAR